MPNATSKYVACVNEPDAQECDPNVRWRLRFVKRELTGKYYFDICFYDRQGKRRIERFDNADRSEFVKIYARLVSYNARLPFDKKEALAFVQELIAAIPSHPFIACSSPGFRRQGL